jgi:aryl-alcohol dehydrogenase-like predicted oxidoreductase
MNDSWITLGETDVKVPPLGIGTWQWGDRWIWGFGSDYGDAQVREAFDAALDTELPFFDTAEVYGLGRSEKFLGQFLDGHRDEVVIATKFYPYPWRLTRGQLRNALRGSLARLGLAQVDLYQYHVNFFMRSVETWAEALADVVDAGLTRAVGISNFNAEQTGRTYNALADRGIPLASNQIEYSLLHRQPERNGVLQTCRDLGVTVIAYSPIAKGLLTGKYTPEHPPPGARKRMYPKEYLQAIQPLIGLMREIGEGHGGKEPVHVALNWLIAKGTVPIPGAKNARHARSNAEALGWRLTDDEVAALDEASEGLDR